MAKKSVMADAKDAVKSLAGAALGAAAAAATTVVAETVTGVMTEAGKKLGDPAPKMEKVAAASTVAKPSKKRAASKTKRKAKKKVIAGRVAKGNRSVKRRKKR
jgi:hypothetical protein